ncbi:hypothetical protein [Burkholderia contaminans]|uniref:hypothetical protein n=1 Tax=Burkholderia contaminans TaxID=488447 RepID=UPI000F58E625|nr:hypothetical protein [Burkholderia contaminans]
MNTPIPVIHGYLKLFDVSNYFSRREIFRACFFSKAKRLRQESALLAHRLTEKGARGQPATCAAIGATRRLS